MADHELVQELAAPKFPLRITRHPESFCIRDADGRPLQYFYYEEEESRRASMKRYRLGEAETKAKSIARAMTDAEEARSRTPPDSPAIPF